MLLEDAPVEIRFLGRRGVERIARRGGGEFAIGHRLLRVRLQPVDPAVTHAVAELLLLPPQDFLRQRALERRAQHVLLDPVAAIGHAAGHLVFRVDTHRHVDEFEIEKRHARLHAPRHHCLVRAQAVVAVQRVELAHGLLVEGLGRRRLVEIQVAAEEFIRALARQHHLHAHRLDPPRQQIHRRGGADGGDVVGLDMPDHLGQRIQPFPERVDEAVMHRAQRVGGDPGGGQIRRTVQPDRERVQPRPPRLAAVVVLHPLARELRRAGGHQRGVEAAGEQHAVGHVGHQLAVHGLLERVPQLARRGGVATRVCVLAPRLVVVAAQLAAGAVVDMPRRKRRHVGTHADQRLHLRCHAQAALRIVSPVQRAHADRVAGDQVALRQAVPQRKREDAVELAHEVRIAVAVQRIDHLAVRAGGEVVGARGAQLAVVVDLAVHRQRQRAVARAQRLRTAGRVDDGQPLVHQDRTGVDEHPAPVRPAMAQALRQLQRLPPQAGQIVTRLQIEHSENRTHGKPLVADEKILPWPQWSAPAFPAYRPAMAITTKARCGRAFVVCFAET